MTSKRIDELADALGKDKHVLLADIERRIGREVERMGSECFSVIEIKGGGRERFAAGVSLPWALRFVQFCRQSRYDGHDLDSPVTEKVVSEVSEAFLKYYEGKAEEISKIVEADLLNREEFVAALSSAVQDTSAFRATGWAAGALLRQQIRSVIVAALQSTQARTIGVQIVGLTSGAVAKLSSSTIGPLIVKQIAIHSKLIAAKLLGSAAFKTMIGAAVKKFAAAAIVAVVAHVLWTLVGAKIAAAIGAAIVPILTVAVLGWVAIAIATLPEKLAKELAKELRKKIDGDFGRINTKVAADIYEQIGSNVGSLVASLVTNEDFNKSVRDCVADLRAA